MCTDTDLQHRSLPAFHLRFQMAGRQLSGSITVHMSPHTCRQKVCSESDTHLLIEAHNLPSLALFFTEHPLQ